MTIRRFSVMTLQVSELGPWVLYDDHRAELERVAREAARLGASDPTVESFSEIVRLVVGEE